MMKNLSRIRKRQLPPATVGKMEGYHMKTNTRIDGGRRGGKPTSSCWRFLLVLLATLAATPSEAFFLSHSPSASSALAVRTRFGDQQAPTPHHHRRQVTALFSAVAVKKHNKKRINGDNGVIRLNGRHKGSRSEQIRIQYVNKKQKWTPAEEQYVEGLISEFSSGQLPIESNITLSRYLATKLNCTQQRIWYKFAGNPIYDGKLKYVRNGCDQSDGPPNNNRDEKSDPMHTSHWTKAEETYAERLISEFNSGQSLDIEEGTTLASYVATKLSCNPKRIWKKFGENPIFDGKVKYMLMSSEPGMTKKKEHDQVRKGHWTPAEEMYAKRLISDFRSGQLPVEEEGTTLASYLAKKLHCNPQRIWKKFGGNPIYNGKVKYVHNRGREQGEDARHTKKKKHVPMRKGHWTPAERQYAEGLISEFKSGQLPIEEGTTLSSYLATMLNCTQKRVWNKFGGNPIYDGKTKYVNSRDPLPPEELIAGQESLLELKRKFGEAADAHPRKKFGLGGKREGAGRPRSRIQKERKRKPKKRRPTFSVMFKRLSDYYRKNGHCLVSADDDDVELYKWTRSIRKNYRHQFLQQVRPKEPAGTQKKKNKKGNKAKQQHKTRRPMLSESKTAMLQRVEFCWDVQEAAWQQKYQQLSDFSERYGHCDLGSHLLAEDQALAIWLQNQRRDYRLWLQDLSNPLTPDRLEALENLGVFEVYKTQQEAWAQHYQYLVEYHQQFGNVDVPQDYRHPVTINVIDDIDHQVHERDTTFALGYWCMNQRRNRKLWDVLQEEDHNREDKGRKKKNRKKETKSSSPSPSPSDGAYEMITTERIRLLNALDFPWNARDTRWNAMLQRLTEYYQTHGHLKIATNDVANQDLRQWLIQQRHYYQRQRKNTPQSSPMTEVRIASMEEAIPNFSWKVFNNTGPSTEDWSNLFDAMRDKGLAPDARPKQHWFEGQNTVAMEVKSEWTEQELIDLWHQDGEDDEEDDDNDNLRETPFANGEGGGLNYFVDVEEVSDPLGTPDSFYGKQKASKSWQWKAYIEKGGADDEHDDEDDEDDDDDFNFFVNLKDTAAALAKSSGANKK